MASRGSYNDVECQNIGENLLNQTQEDVTSIYNADFFDLSDPEKRGEHTDSEI